MKFLCKLLWLMMVASAHSYGYDEFLKDVLEKLSGFSNQTDVLLKKQRDKYFKKPLQDLRNGLNFLADEVLIKTPCSSTGFYKAHDAVGVFGNSIDDCYAESVKYSAKNLADFMKSAAELHSKVTVALGRYQKCESNLNESEKSECIAARRTETDPYIATYIKLNIERKNIFNDAAKQYEACYEQRTLNAYKDYEKYSKIMIGCHGSAKH